MSEARVKAAVDKLTNEFQRWLDSEVDEVTEQLEDAVDGALLTFGAMDVGQEYQAVARLVERLEEPWARWKETLGSRGSQNNYPARAWFAAMKELMAAWIAHKPPVMPSIEPVALLVAQGCSPRQIATIYDWILPDGQADLDRVYEEIEKPGRHTKNKMNPLEVRQRRDQEAKLKALEDVMTKRASTRMTEVKEAVEGLDTLVAQGLSRQQLRLNLPHVTDQEIDDSAARQGLMQPPEHYDTLASVRGIFENGPSAADEAMLDGNVFAGRGERVPVDDAGEPVLTDEVRQRIIALAASGLAPREIRRVVAVDGLTTKEIRQLIESLAETQ